MTSNDPTGRGKPRRKAVIRFAGEAFAHANAHNDDMGPMARHLTAEVAWKQPPGQKELGKFSQS